jgi:hypothetical protein
MPARTEWWVSVASPPTAYSPSAQTTSRRSSAGSAARRGARAKALVAIAATITTAKASFQARLGGMAP